MMLFYSIEIFRLTSLGILTPQTPRWYTSGLIYLQDLQDFTLQDFYYCINRRRVIGGSILAFSGKFYAFPAFRSFFPCFPAFRHALFFSTFPVFGDSKMSFSGFWNTSFSGFQQVFFLFRISTTFLGLFHVSAINCNDLTHHPKRMIKGFIRAASLA